MVKEKKFTLNKTWGYCMSMWRWIDRQKKAGSRTDVISLKGQWLREHGFSDIFIERECFFCHYRSTHVNRHGDPCHNCPGCMVDREFGCFNSAYNYRRRPKKFFNKLRSLDRKRKKSL